MTARSTRGNASWQRYSVTNDCSIGAINFIIGINLPWWIWLVTTDIVLLVQIYFLLNLPLPFTILSSYLSFSLSCNKSHYANIELLNNNNDMLIFSPVVLVGKQHRITDEKLVRTLSYVRVIWRFIFGCNICHAYRRKSRRRLGLCVIKRTSREVRNLTSSSEGSAVWMQFVRVSLLSLSLFLFLCVTHARAGCS